MQLRRSNLPMLFAAAIATGLGIVFGLPMILHKNGFGLLVVLIIAAITISGIALVTRWLRGNDREDLGSKMATSINHAIGYGIASLCIGPLITVGGFLIIQWFSPIHPLDFAPMLTSLAILGVFAGLTVGIVLSIAAILWPS